MYRLSTDTITFRMETNLMRHNQVSKNCLTICIFIFHPLNKIGKYIAFALIMTSSFCSVPCFGYDPVGTLFDLEESHSIEIQSSHEGRDIPLLISLPEKKGLLPVILLVTDSVVLGTATSTFEHTGRGGDMRQFSFNIQGVTNRFFKVCLLVKPYANFVTLPLGRIWIYGWMT